MDESIIKWVLSDQTVDPVSNVQYAAVVFMLYYSLELKHNLLKTSEQLMRDLPAEICDFGETSLYVAGSAAQGFYLHTDDFLESRDIDIVAVYKKDIRKECEYDKEGFKQKLTVHLNDGDQNDNENAELCEDKTKNVNVTEESGPAYLNIETWDDTYPGYVMLRKCRKHEFPVQPSLRNRYVSSFETTRSRTDFWGDVLSYLADEFHSILDHPRDKEADVLTSIHTQGPATSITFCHRFIYLCIDADLVYALRYPKDPNNLAISGWPELARKWLERIPASGWPSAELKSDIVASGCLLVPKGHIGSKREDYEWRISFSLAELKLARSLNRIQREIAHTLKAVLCEEQYQYGRASINAKLDSYFILNLLFAESEIIAPEAWQEKNIAGIIFRLLDKLASSIKTRNLPHYFVEDNNLLYRLLMEQVKIGKGEFKRGDKELDEMMDSDEYADFALYTVLRLRHDPLAQLLQQASYHRLPGALHDAVFGPFVKEAKTSPQFQPTIYAATLIKLAKAHLYMDNFKEAHIYIQNAEIFYASLVKKDGKSNIKSDLEVTKAVCSYMAGEYNTALQLFEDIYQNNDGMHSNILKENEIAIMVLLARALTSKAAIERAVDGKSMKSKSKIILEKVLFLSFDPRVALELVNFFMVTGFYPEADELLMKIEDYIIEEDNYVIEPTEDEESHIYYGEAYAVPVVEEPIYIVDKWEAEDIENQDDTNILQNECQVGRSGEPDNFGIEEAGVKKTEYHMQCEPTILDCVENSETVAAAKKYIQPKSSEAEMELEMNELKPTTADHTSDATMSYEHGDLEQHDTLEITHIFADEPEAVVNEMIGQEEQLMLASELNSLDITYTNYFSGSENTNQQDSDDDMEEGTYANIFSEIEDQFDSIMRDDDDDSGPILDFHENQDLINLSALARAFSELGLIYDAQRVRQRVLDKVHERQKVDKKATVDALEHDLDMYISNKEQYNEETYSILKGWLNPFYIFKEDVMYSLADENILDEVLKSLVHKYSVVRLSVKDLYFHHHIQLAKFDGKTNKALDLVKHIRNENLKSIHYEVLGDEVEASISARYASYERKNEPVYNMVSKWMKKLTDAVGKFEPRNIYLESVFK